MIITTDGYLQDDQSKDDLWAWLMLERKESLERYKGFSLEELQIERDRLLALRDTVRDRILTANTSTDIGQQSKAVDVRQYQRLSQWIMSIEVLAIDLV